MNHVTVSSSPAKVTLHYGQPVKVTLRYDQKGERGIGISSVALDEQAHLIVTYDDGKKQDAGAALGDVTSIKDGIDSAYQKIQTSEANVTKLEASTRTNAEKAKQALQDTQNASASGVNNINTLTTEKMTYITNTFNSLLTRAKANIDQWERDAEDKIHKERTYSLKQIKIAHDDAMVDIERSVNKAEAWAVSETTPDREPDFESPTGLTQSSRSWALYSKKKAQDAADTLIAIKDNEANVSSMKNDVEELLRRTQESETNAENSYNKTASIQSNFQVVLDTAKASANSASASATSASNSATSAASSATAARNSATAAATSATNANNSETQAYEYKTSASDSATAAASSASSASESATDARAAMNTANTAASSASTSATNASTSASNASKSEIAAKTAQAVAEKARDDVNSAINKVAGAMKYVGQVDNYSDLADVTKNKGDVWNIVNADSEHGIKAGDNVAWNGTDWDNLSGVVDLSAYAEKVDYQKVITSATANGATITFNHKDGTTSTATVNNVASATAATNDAKGQKIDTTYEKIADASNVHTYLQNSINGLSTGKQDKLTFDNTPTANSSNPVTSGGIKTALDTKLDKTGTAVSASKLKTARTISLTGDASGSATFDGSGNVSINTTVSQAANADTVDGVHASSLFYNKGNWDGNEWKATGAYQTNGGSPVSGAYNYGQVISSSTGDARFQLYAAHLNNSGNGRLYYRTGWDSDKQPWNTILDSDNYNNYAPTKTGSGASGTWGINITGNSGTATKLSTARAITTNLASTSSAYFDGSANVTPGVTGILPVANGGTGASSLSSITVGKATTADSAAKATSDSSGNNIANTYATKADTYTKTEVDNKMVSMIDLFYPVGSVYISADNNKTKADFPFMAYGTWEEIPANLCLQTGNVSEAGTQRSAGLPNITGGIDIADNLCVTNLSVSQLQWGNAILRGENGALQKTTSIYGEMPRAWTYNNGVLTADDKRRIQLDASKSNPIYGSSNTVQPPAYMVRAWVWTA